MDFPSTYADAAMFGVSLFLKATLVLIIACVISGLLRRRSAAFRHAIWALALATLLALPVFSLWMPPIEVDTPGIGSVIQRFRVQPQAVISIDPPASPHTEGLHGTDKTSQVLFEESPAAAHPGSQQRQSGYVILVAWFAVATGLTILFLTHLIRIRLITRYAEPRDAVTTVANGVAAHLDLKQRPRILIGQVAMPMTWGLFRPVVLLPMEAIEWSPDRLRIVLMHELAHVQRRDYASHIAAELCCILYWPNPLVWMARSRLRTELEQACDDVVLRAGAPSYDYAEHLVEIARGLQTRMLFTGGVWMAGRHKLKSRIRLILDPHIERRGVSALAFLFLLLAIGLPALSVAALRTVDRDLGPAGPRAASARDIGVASADSVSQDRTDVASSRTSPDSMSTAHRQQPPLTMTREAESGRIVPPMRMHRDESASGGRFVSVPDGSGNDPPDGGPGRITFDINLDADAVYRVWARVIGDRDNDNSFFVSIDDEDEFIWDIKDRRGERVPRWQWLPITDRSGRAATLDGGNHSLTFRNREDGSLLDAVLITADHDLVPVGRTPLPRPTESVSISIEAEQPATLTAPLEIRTNSEASGRLYLAVADGFRSRHRPPEDGRAVYHLRVPVAGYYMCWARIITPDDDANSFWVRANGGDWIRWNDMSKDDDWNWQLLYDSDDEDDAAFLSLRAGDNELEIAYREDGAKIDRMFVTNDSHSVPWETDDERSDVTVLFKD